MEKVEIVFKKPTGDVKVDMVAVRFKHGERAITMFTNLIQNFLLMDDRMVVPEEVAEKPSRMFMYKDKQLIEFDDLLYAVKYRMNNGLSYDSDYTLTYLRIEDAINNLKKSEMREKVINCLKDGEKNI